MEQYERLKILGVGSYGKVYLMRHRQQRRLVCAKIIKIKNIPRKEREACRTEVFCATDNMFELRASCCCFTTSLLLSAERQCDQTREFG